MSSYEVEFCPFCGSDALYEGYRMVNARMMPFMSCETCGAMVTFEGSEHWVTDESDGMKELEAHWNSRPKHVVGGLAVNVQPHIDWDRMADELEKAAKGLRGMRDAQ